MTQAQCWSCMSLREVRRTKKRQLGLKDPTAAQAVGHVALEEVRLEDMEGALNVYEQRQLKTIKSWCRRRARRRRQLTARQVPTDLMT
jgi:hypothetical protein